MSPTTKSIVFSIVLGTALAGCLGDNIRLDSSPAVSLSSDKSSGVGPLEIQLFSSVVNGNGILKYRWDFGDGAESDEANPQHVFEANSQAYNVVLTVTDEDGDEGAANLRVAVGSNNQPTVMVQATPAQGEVPLTVGFSCEIAGGNGHLNLEWSFGQGSTDRFANTTFTYTARGVYVAACTVEDEDGDLARDTVTIGVGIVPADAGPLFEDAGPIADAAQDAGSTQGIPDASPGGGGPADASPILNAPDSGIDTPVGRAPPDAAVAP